MRNFKLNIILRILLIAFILGLLAYLIFVSQHVLRSAYLGIFLVILIFEFVWYVDRINRDLKTFFLAILQNDFTTTFSEKGKGRSFNDLYDTFNQITQKFKSISSEKETQHVYLEALVEHVKVGILSYDENEKVLLMNEAARTLLNKSQLWNLKALESVDPILTEHIRSIKSGETRLVKTSLSGDLLQLNIHCSEFKLQSEYNKLISLQNIKNELEANEMEAWQKLIRVLTHEIMNSVTPIASLTGTLKQIVKNGKGESNEANSELLNQVWIGLDAIENRSTGLQSFTEAYRRLTRIPTPNFASVDVHKLVNRTLQLMSSDLDNINLIVNVDKNIRILADADLINQVLINLIKNSAEALENTESPQLRIDCNSKNQITLTDNGSGISEDKLDKIFIPFFTTKKEGSGIGLALSKQIMQLHNGKIEMISKLTEGTQFKLIF